MPATYEPIATTTLGTAAASITFSSISSAYTDLRLVLVGTTATDDGCRLRFNSDTGSNYSVTRLRGNGTAAASDRFTSQTSIIAGAAVLSATTPTLRVFDLFSYAGSTNKTLLLSEASDFNGTGAVSNIVGLWRNSSAINTILIFTSAGVNFSVGTTATLYGILRA